MPLPVHSIRVTSDTDLLRFIGNIYAVLLTRGVLGTHVYASEPALREHLPPPLLLATSGLGA